MVGSIRSVDCLENEKDLISLLTSNLKYDIISLENEREVCV